MITPKPASLPCLNQLSLKPSRHLELLKPLDRLDSLVYLRMNYKKLNKNQVNQLNGFFSRGLREWSRLPATPSCSSQLSLKPSRHLELLSRLIIWIVWFPTYEFTRITDCEGFFGCGLRTWSRLPATLSCLNQLSLQPSRHLKVLNRLIILMFVLSTFAFTRN